VFDWLFEGRLAVYLVLAATAAVLVMLWTRDRKRRWLLLAGFPVALMGLYFLLDLMVETGREQIGRKLQAMSAAVRARDADGILTHVSESFQYEQSGRITDKVAFRRAVESAFDHRDVDEVRISGAAMGEKAGKVTFMVKPVGGRVREVTLVFFCEATFVKDPDGQWRLGGFILCNPVDHKERILIPGL
jgi:hypothetical protein